MPPLPPTPPNTSSSGQKKQLNWLLPAVAAILAAGGGLSYYLHTEKKASEEQTVHLKKDAADLSEKITLLRKKQNDARKNNQSKLLKEEENARLLAILRKKEKEVEQTRQKYNSALTELSDANKRTETLEKELVKITKDKIRPDTRERVNANTVTPPMINPPCPETDALLRQTSIAYLKARKHGTAAVLSGHFAPYCNYQYANNREVSNEMVMNNVREFWKKWPRRGYRLLKVAYQNNHVEIIYIYKYADQKGRSIQGYAKEMWETNSIGQIIHWREELNSNMPPDESAGYRLAPLNIK